MAKSGPFTRLPPPPRVTGDPMFDLRETYKWFDRIWLILSGVPGISWDTLSKVGSDIADIETREHNDLQFQRAEVTTTYDIVYQDTTVLCDASGGAFQVNLPDLADGVGVTNIKKMDSSANAVTVAAQAGETLDGAASFDLELQHESITVEPSTTEWVIV